MKTSLYFIRHGETEWNKDGRYQGQQDIALNETGLTQAEKLAKYLLNERIRINAIYSSDLQRAVQTAEKVAVNYNLTVQVNYGLRERNYGLLEGVKFVELKKKYPDIDLKDSKQTEHFKIEPFPTLKQRVYGAVLDLTSKHMNENIIIISHGGVINSFLHHISNGNVGSGITKLLNTGVTTVIYNHKFNKWEIKEINSMAHLSINVL